MATNRKSHALEAERTRRSEQLLIETLDVNKRSYAIAARSTEQELEAERDRSAALEAENKELRARLHAMNTLLKQMM